jgi:hypothetical protein
MYGDRVNQVDVRFSKLLRYRQTRTAVTFDLFNLLNANPVLTQNNSYSSWLTPLSILQPRFLKLGVQFDF